MLITLSLRWVSTLGHFKTDDHMIVDEKLKFDTHTVTQANKANIVLGLVRRTFDNMDG